MSFSFRCKQFEVRQQSSAFKVGTDSVMLGAWANILSAETILDAGTGTGILAMMSAQRNSHAMITGLDIDEFSIQEAKENFYNCPWGNRLIGIQGDLLNHTGKYHQYYDHIVSNPPYFLDSLLPKDPRKATARHIDSSWETWLSAILKALKKDGLCSFIIPATSYSTFIKEAALMGLHVSRETSISSRKGSSVIRYMLELSKDPMKIKERGHLNIYENQAIYSPEYMKLTEDFYLSF